MVNNKYEKVKFYYDRGLWCVSRVYNAVVKGWITTEEYYMITSRVYEVISYGLRSTR